ncbi:MAG: cupin domain-containing protein [Planctomycetota bacterium]
MMQHRVREAEVAWYEVSSPSGERTFKVKSLGQAVGAKRLGTSLYEIPPGGTAWPFHYHCANEEAIFVLSGRGHVRLTEESLEVQEGDYVTFPVGEDGAHQIRCEGEEPLRFLCLSTMIEPDIAVYPDSGKFGLFAGGAPGTPPESRWLLTFVRQDATMQYWDGEDG